MKFSPLKIKIKKEKLLQYFIKHNVFQKEKELKIKEENQNRKDIDLKKREEEQEQKEIREQKRKNKELKNLKLIPKNKMIDDQLTLLGYLVMFTAGLIVGIFTQII